MPIIKISQKDADVVAAAIRQIADAETNDAVLAIVQALARVMPENVRAFTVSARGVFDLSGRDHVGDYINAAKARRAEMGKAA